MLKINLVPEKTKKEINLKKAYSTIRAFNYVLVFLIVLISAIFISSKSFLIKSSNIEASSVVAGQESSEYKKLVEINTKLAAIKNIIDNNHSHLDIIKNIAEKTPYGISLSRLKIDTNNRAIEITGKSDLRDTLLGFKENLEKDPLYTNINFPLQNILKKENINFSITAKLNFEETPN